jgi:Holliday junction resolvasome RuvABC endonuclease subunit
MPPTTRDSSSCRSVTPVLVSRKLRLVGMDPSLRNWGLACASYDMATGHLHVDELSSTHPALPTGKQVRQNSSDLEAAYQLFKGAHDFATRWAAHAVFIEVPVGSQSARAMASYGVCVGVCGALKANGIPFFEVTATEVKLAGAGKKDASKAEMIAWGLRTHPEAKWPMHQGQVSAAKAEHQADAVAAIHAGIKLTAFKQLLSLATATT